jgi:hypothetical protein
MIIVYLSISKQKHSLAGKKVKTINYIKMQCLSFKKVSRLAKEKIEPRVREMEEKGDILPEIRELVFQNGVCI